MHRLYTRLLVHVSPPCTCWRVGGGSTTRASALRRIPSRYFHRTSTWPPFRLRSLSFYPQPMMLVPDRYCSSQTCQNANWFDLVAMLFCPLRFSANNKKCEHTCTVGTTRERSNKKKVSGVETRHGNTLQDFSSKLLCCSVDKIGSSGAYSQRSVVAFEVGWVKCS